MKPLALYGDPEVLAKDYLAGRLQGRPEPYVTGATVGLVLPATWRRQSLPPHVLVAHDGTPELTYPVTARATVRVVVWHRTASQAKALAGLCMGLLLIHPGDPSIANVLSLTGILPAVDDETGADLASFTVRVTLRGRLIT